MKLRGCGLFSLAVLAGCAQVLGIEETTYSPEPPADDDVVDSGSPPAPGEDYRCIGKKWLQAADSDTIEIIARIIEIETSAAPNPTPVVGLTVSACRSRLDISCNRPKQAVSDENGLVRLEVDRGFNGYLRIEGPDASGVERVGYLWYFSQPLVDTYVFPILAMTPQFREEVIYGSLLGSNLRWDPERGEIAINVTDCSTPEPPTQDVEGELIRNAPGVNAPGVHFEITDEEVIDERTRAFYFSEGSPIWPRGTRAQVTDSSGLGGFLSVPPGPIPIRAVPRALEEPSASDTLLVRANFLTTVRLLPE